MAPSSCKLPLLVAACVALLAAHGGVAAECSGPEAYGDAYAVEQKAEGLTPKLENDELVITVSAEGLAPSDGCPVPAAQQFELTWFKHNDLAMIKLKRTAPKQCVTGLRGGGGRSQGVELRIPLPEELKHGTAHGDFSRMLVGIPPGGLYESYLLFDNSMLTGTAQQWTEQEAKSEAEAAAAKLELFPLSADAPLPCGCKEGECKCKNAAADATADAPAPCGCKGECKCGGAAEGAAAKDGVEDAATAATLPCGCKEGECKCKNAAAAAPCGCKGECKCGGAAEGAGGAEGAEEDAEEKLEDADEGEAGEPGDDASAGAGAQSAPRKAGGAATA